MVCVRGQIRRVMKFAFPGGRVGSVERGEVDGLEAFQQVGSRPGDLGRRMIRNGIRGVDVLGTRGQEKLIGDWVGVGLLELVEGEVDGPDSVENVRDWTELLLFWSSLRAESVSDKDGGYDEVEGEEEIGGCEPTGYESPRVIHSSP
ncbi:hypothetical protein F2P56_002463 [Juglans regia]|uniref:Uncharacterized protein n=1 Tax=Juglans regia TaxID=51240 RepID=A0A833YCA3_JUGRE|nr:hypothetical protein F2P56_002463 [Juglans regia]